jgi:starch-binding outer membrane protein, SusD/RagB family
MNFFKTLLLVVLAGNLFQGCNDNLLDTIPNDRISSEIFWQNDEDAEKAANAVYTFLSENPNNFFSWDGMTDIGHTNAPESSESLILRGAA